MQSSSVRAALFFVLRAGYTCNVDPAGCGATPRPKHCSSQQVLGLHHGGESLAGDLQGAGKDAGHGTPSGGSGARCFLSLEQGFIHSPYMHTENASKIILMKQGAKP